MILVSIVIALVATLVYKNRKNTRMMLIVTTVISVAMIISVISYSISSDLRTANIIPETEVVRVKVLSRNKGLMNDRVYFKSSDDWGAMLEEDFYTGVRIGEYIDLIRKTYRDSDGSVMRTEYETIEE